MSKFLDSAGSRLDYRRYAEPLLDVLFAGGILGMMMTCLTLAYLMSVVGFVGKDITLCSLVMVPELI